MISYYELLGMIKEDKAPNKIRVHLTSEPRIYEAEYDGEDFNCYCLSKNSVEDGDYKCYLADSYLEGMMFDKTIEILGEKEIKLPLLVNPSSNELEINDTLVKIVDKIKKIENMLER